MDSQRAITVRDQVDRILRERIYSGEYELGTRLPPEAVLAKELGVSRATLRSALGKLEAEGVVTRRHGDGTYLNRHAVEVDARPTQLMAFRTMIEKSGRKATVTTLSIRSRLPVDEECDKLQSPPGEPVVELICLFLADDQPAIYSVNRYAARVVLPADLEVDVRIPMADFIKHYSGQQVTYSISDFCAVVPPPEAVQYLGIAPTAPILMSTDLFYGLKDVPLALGNNYFHPDQYRLRLAQSWMG
jgi:GntR family transcriptional regulator